MDRGKGKSKHYLIPMFLVPIVVVSLFYFQFQNTIEIIKLEHEAKIDLIEQSLFNELKYTEIVNQMIESDIQKRMKQAAYTLIQEYGQNPHVLEWDLGEMKRQFGGLDIYILNKDLVIETSTVASEIGFDFDAYPRFSRLLKQRLAGNQFEADAINFSFEKNELKTYSYMPTPDHEYLFEFSVTIKDLYPHIEDLNVANLSTYIKGKHPFIEDIRIFRYERETNEVFVLGLPSEESGVFRAIKIGQTEFIKLALDKSQTQERTFSHEGSQYTLKYIPFRTLYDNVRMVWWKPYVMEILYNDQSVMDIIASQEKLYVQILATIATFYSGLLFTFIHIVQKNRKMAYTDYLTKLPNRKSFEETLQAQMPEIDRKNTKLAVFFFDLDDFKGVNDTFGHNFGDKVLQEVARRAKEHISLAGLVARLGGDEFIGLFSGFSSEQEMVKAGEEILKIFATPFGIDSREIIIKGSMGISIYPDHGHTIETLMLKADHAMYEAKQNQLGYAIYSERDNQLKTKRGI